jgi:hypothetical protein
VQTPSTLRRRLAIYGYLANALVEMIASGVLTGAIAERRRRHVIESMSDHTIIWGYGRAKLAPAEAVAG